MSESREPTPDREVLSRRDFDYKGVAATEIVCRYGSDLSKRKLLWCLAPFEQMVVGGKKNFLVHYDFGHPDNTVKSETGARDLVAAEFDRLHNLA